MIARRHAAQRMRALVVTAVACVVVMGVALLPAAADPVDPVDSTVPESTAPESTAPPTTVPSSSTTAPVTGATTTTTVPSGTTTTTLPGRPRPGTDPKGDPVGAGDATSDTVPRVAYTIPPRLPGDPIIGGLGASTLVIGELSAAKGALLDAQHAYDDAVARVGSLQAAIEASLARLSRLDAAQRAAVRRYAALESEVATRAADAYIGAPSGNELASALFGSRNATDVGRRRVYAASVLDSLRLAGVRLRAARAAMSATLVRTAVGLSRDSRALAVARVVASQSKIRLLTAGFAVRAFAAGSQIFVSGFVFPVADPHDFIDSFGAPRMTGTADAHFHEGTDIMAAAGTPLFACERGVVTSMSSNSLGGTTVWLKGVSGTSYYYAHLSAYAPGLAPGQVVEAGTTLGFVGNTGNAQFTAAHLHFEIHPNDGPAVNPYPLLKLIDDLGHGRPTTGATSTTAPR